MSERQVHLFEGSGSWAWGFLFLFFLLFSGMSGVFLFYLINLQCTWFTQSSFSLLLIPFSFWVHYLYVASASFWCPFLFSVFTHYILALTSLPITLRLYLRFIKVAIIHRPKKGSSFVNSLICVSFFWRATYLVEILTMTRVAICFQPKVCNLLKTQSGL